MKQHASPEPEPRGMAGAAGIPAALAVLFAPRPRVGAGAALETSKARGAAANSSEPGCFYVHGADE